MPDQMMRGVGKAHALQHACDPLLSFGARNAVEAGGQHHVFFAGQRAIGRKQLRHIADVAAHVGRLAHESKPASVAVPDVGGSRVVSILMSVLLPAPLGPISPKISALIDCQRHMIDGG